MTRYFIDCREMPSDANCSVKISADDKAELLEAAVDHAVGKHGHEDSVELRLMLQQGFHEETGALTH